MVTNNLISNFIKFGSILGKSVLIVYICSKQQDSLNSRVQAEVESKDNATNTQQRHCNCKNSKCLKL